jgi:WD40 repeat protein
MPNFVKAIVSKKQLTLIPDIASDSADETANGENEFDITVVNESKEFTSFQIELSTPGADANSNLKWYTLDPEVCVKKPPGASTKFHVVITKSPIQVYDTTIDLTLKVFSVEFASIFTSQKLKLTIQKARKPLKIYLITKELKVYPGNLVEIPVIAYNLSQKFANVKVSISGLNPEWMTQGTVKNLQIDASDSEKTSFWCQPPINAETLSQKYDFTIEAHADYSSHTPHERGILEILPQGTVEFICSNKLQVIPTKKGKGSSKKLKFATYELLFENKSNLPQQVNIQISEKDQKQCDLVIPDGVILAPGETKPMYLVAKKQRSLLGFKKRLLFEVSPILANPDTAKVSNEILPHPSSQVLELQIWPIVPFLLQAVGLLLLLLLLWLLKYLNPRIYHEGPVNSVRLIGIAGTVISGSSDQTIRRWQVDNSLLQNSNRLKHEDVINIKKETQKGVRVIRQRPEPDYIIAAGLESGEIQLWDVLLKRRMARVYEPDRKTDRVFDLEFTQNSYYLFSAHGSGEIRRWDVQKINQNAKIHRPISKAKVNFTISTLGISESLNKPGSLVVVAGRFNKLALWDWVNTRIYNLEYDWLDWKQNNEFVPIIGQHHYITGLAIAEANKDTAKTDDAKNFLVTADNQGYITLWNMDIIRQCIIDNQSNLNREDEKMAGKDGFGNTFQTLECSNAKLAQWRNGDANHRVQPVRSVAITQNGCYIVSGGDDGRVMLWSSDEIMRSPKYQTGKIIAQFPDITLNSVDIKAINDYLLITTGDDNNRVRLYREEVKDNASCK